MPSSIRLRLSEIVWYCKVGFILTTNLAVGSDRCEKRSIPQELKPSCSTPDRSLKRLSHARPLYSLPYTNVLYSLRLSIAQYSCTKCELYLHALNGFYLHKLCLRYFLFKSGCFFDREKQKLIELFTQHSKRPNARDIWIRSFF